MLTPAYNKRLQDLTAVFNQRVGARQRLEADIAMHTERLNVLTFQLQTDTKAKVVLDALAKLTEKNVKNYIEPLVTEALQAVFGYSLRFGMTFEVERNQVAVKFSLTDAFNNTVTGSMEDMKGGGVIDVVGVVLQFVLLELLGLEGPILLDEPGKFVDANHQQAFGALLESFAERFGRQIVIVTHDAAICAVGARHYHVQLDNAGVSRVQLVED